MRTVFYASPASDPRIKGEIFCFCLMYMIETEFVAILFEIDVLGYKSFW